MEVKKSPKANLENKKGVFFEIGLVLALAALLFAFQWKGQSSDTNAFQAPPDEEADEEIIPITQQILKPPPPPPPAPKLTELIEIVEDEANVDEDLEILDAEDESENKVPIQQDDYGDYGDEQVDADIFDVVEDMPMFPYGSITKWISKHVHYPTLAVENGISGKVYVKFVIERDGSVSNAKIIRGVESTLDKEALRVVNLMPKWKPGKQRGKPVRVAFTLPINFQLSQ